MARVHQGRLGMGTEDTTDTSLQSSSRKPPERHLELVWCWPPNKARRHGLTRSLLIGRGLECDIRLDDSEASRRHAEIVREGSVIQLNDCGSRNGTYVNGARIERVKLIPGDVCRIGRCIALVARTMSNSSGERSDEFRALATGLLGGPLLAGALHPAQVAAPGSLPILIEGETGVGKERVARAIHEWSGRTGAFIGVNCAAIPDSLAEAELFGYRRGAFTNALQSSLGYFRSANGGTLLLDEVDTLTVATQAKLLRVLEEREVIAIGEQVAHPVDVRIVCTTREPLATAVSLDRFRPDLFARLAGLVVRVPALRERAEDIPPLLAHFLEQVAFRPGSVDPCAIERLLRHDFPMNVRELRLVAHRLSVFRESDERLKLRHVLTSLEVAASVQAAARSGLSRSAQRAEDSEALREALSRCDGNLQQAASMVGISRQRAYRLLHTDGETRLSVLRRERSDSKTGSTGGDNGKRSPS